MFGVDKRFEMTSRGCGDEDESELENGGEIEHALIEYRLLLMLVLLVEDIIELLSLLVFTFSILVTGTCLLDCVGVGKAQDSTLFVKVDEVGETKATGECCK